MNKDIRHSLYRLTLIGTALAASLAAAGARADQVIGVMENVSSGGEILLTDDKCGSKGKGRITLATSAGGQVSHVGCARPFRPDRVLVEWQRGSGSSVLPMSYWSPNATGRSLKSFSDAELDMLFVRTAWFEGKDTKPWWKDAPLAKPAPTAILAGPATTPSRRIPR